MERIIVKSKLGLLLLSPDQQLAQAQIISQEPESFYSLINAQQIFIRTKNFIKIYNLNNQLQNITIEGTNFINHSIQEDCIFVVDKLSKDNFKQSVFDLKTLGLLFTIDLPQLNREYWPWSRMAGNVIISIEILKIVARTLDGKIISEIGIDYQVFGMEVQKVGNDWLVFTFNATHIQVFKLKNNNIVKVYNKQVEVQKILKNSTTTFILSVVHQQTDSYYNANQLHYFDLQKNNLKIIETQQGPIHDILVNDQQLIVVQGYMPAKSILYSNDFKPSFDFGQNHKNSLIINQQKRFLIIAGFGQLDGSIDVWDVKNFSKIGAAQAKTSTLCLWSPTGRTFLVATTSPRMNVGNVIKVFKYDGSLLNTIQFNNGELFDVQYLLSDQQYPNRSPSPKKELKLTQNEEKPKEIKKINFTFAQGSFAQQLKTMKDAQISEARFIQQNEHLNAKPQVQLKPGQVQIDKPKKKRNRKKKNANEEPEHSDKEEN